MKNNNTYKRDNWRVTVYDKKDKIIDSWVIENRTENEAENEAIADLPYEMNDWTMTKCN